MPADQISAHNAELQIGTTFKVAAKEISSANENKTNTWNRVVPTLIPALEMSLKMAKNDLWRSDFGFMFSNSNFIKFEGVP